MTKLTCEYCKQDFKRQVNFDKHECDAKIKYTYLKSAQGQAAFHYYKHWLNLYKHSSSVSQDTFLSSRYFISFQKFMIYANKMLLPNKEAFVKYMISLDILPTLWCKDEIYIRYIENYDKVFTPSQQAEETVKTLYELSRIFECKVNEVFESLETGDCIKLLKTRRLSPWVLLLSSLFARFLQTKFTSEQQNLLQTVINPQLWKGKFKNAPEDVKQMKEIVIALKL